jgi:LCP family protein required for cell wall assembly
VILAITITYKINSSLKDLDMDTTNVILHEEDDKDIKEREASRLEVKNVDVKEEKPEDFYMLLVGLDYRENIFSLNTDSIIVSHIIPQNQTMKLISLPRDLRVENLREQLAKVNSVFADGYQHALAEGRKDPSLLSGKRAKIGTLNVPEEYISSGSVVLRETVEKFMDIDIDYTFLVNFQTVTSLVDEIGGIEIDVDRSMEYDDPTDNTHIHLEKGLQKLNGEDALNFSRFREDNRGPDFFSNDFERGIRQQQVIMALASELSSWSNVTRIFNLLDIISSNFKTDMGTNRMGSLVRTFHGHLNSDSIISIPFEGYWESPYVKISEENLEKLKNNFTSIEMPEPPVEVSVE